MRKVSIEGACKKYFPSKFAELFEWQYEISMLLYTLLIALILLSMLLNESPKKCFKINRHFVSFFVILSCAARTAYIYYTDVNCSGSTVYAFEYVARPVIDVLWFSAFAYLAFYWCELQSKTLKQNAVNVASTNKNMYLVIFGFVALSVLEAVTEELDMDFLFTAASKGGCCMYILVFSMYTRRRTLRLKHAIELMRDRMTSAYTRQNNESTSERKKTAAADKFSNSVRNESLIATVWIIEQVALMALKERNIISLQTTPLLIFALKVIQRLTEWLMVSRTQNFIFAACILHYKVTKILSHRQQLILS